MSFKQVGIRISSLLFPFLSTICIAGCIAEVYSYSGFFQKYFYFPIQALLAFLIIVAIIAVPFNRLKQKGLTYTQVYILTAITSLLLPLTIFTYYSLASIEGNNYPNYIYTKYHISINTIPQLILCEITIFITGFLSIIPSKLLDKLTKLVASNNDVGTESHIDNFIKLVVAIIGIWIFSKYVLNTYLITLKVNKNFPSFYGYTYDMKMREYWGSIYDYFLFVKNNTPEDSTILIPPQQAPWQTEGNAGLVRYFLYPRKVINGELSNLDISNVDYILIAWGSWGSNDPSIMGWPKVNIEADRIVIWEPKSNQQTSSDQKIFKPDNSSETWGIIKPKK